MVKTILAWDKLDELQRLECKVMTRELLLLKLKENYIESLSNHVEYRR